MANATSMKLSASPSSSAIVFLRVSMRWNCGNWVSVFCHKVLIAEFDKRVMCLGSGSLFMKSVILPWFLRF